ncbi:MAG: YggS family pyridoxal phosphate-dependent enzyme, partial [Flavisolibacter sp.]
NEVLVRQDFLILNMAVNQERYRSIKQELDAQSVTLVAVSKIRTVQEILALYELGQRDFGENYVQELVDKQKQLPGDIRWHFIGHLQKNKIKFIAPFIHLVQGVDSFKLLEALNKQGMKEDRVINCLLQVHIASEETKFGFSTSELDEMFTRAEEIRQLSHIQIKGLMGMASFSDDMEQVRKEFAGLKTVFNKTQSVFQSDPFNILSMGMSADYQLAVKEGSNMVRIGSMLFGKRG